MINAIGEAVMQQTSRASYNNSAQIQDTAIQETERVKEARPVEASEDGQKSEMNMKNDENTTKKNSLEEGKIFVEKYDEDGKLIARTPPGYVLEG